MTLMVLFVQLKPKGAQKAKARLAWILNTQNHSSNSGQHKEFHTTANVTVLSRPSVFTERSIFNQGPGGVVGCYCWVTATKWKSFEAEGGGGRCVVSKPWRLGLNTSICKMVRVEVVRVQRSTAHTVKGYFQHPTS